MSMQTKPSIVFVHGLWADGSCFGKVIDIITRIDLAQYYRQRSKKG